MALLREEDSILQDLIVLGSRLFHLTTASADLPSIMTGVLNHFTSNCRSLIMSFMMRFGLIVLLISSAIDSQIQNQSLYCIPSLLPANPFLLVLDDKIEDRKLRNIIGCDTIPMKNIGVHYSLFCFLPRQGLSVAL